MKRVVLSVLVVALAACAGTALQPMPHLVPYSESDLAWAAKPGTGTITGQAFLKTRGGDVKYAAGTPIHLLPVSPYTTEWFNTEIVQGKVMAPADSAVGKYERDVIGDGTGHFNFTGLPAGKYYIYSTISWEIPGQYGLQRTGGHAFAVATVADGQTVNVIATE